MNKITSFLLTVVLAACGQSETPTSVAVPTVEELATNPERLKELRQQCKLDRAKLGDTLCNAVAEATRRRFMGDGVTPYTPSPPAPTN